MTVSCPKLFWKSPKWYFPLIMSLDSGKVRVSSKDIIVDLINAFKRKLLFKYSCLHLHLTMVPHPTHPYLPPSNLPPLILSMGPLDMFLDGPSPIFPHYPSPCSPLVTVSLFSISMFLVIFCLLICFVD